MGKTKENLQEKLEKRQARVPNSFCYRFMCHVAHFLFKKTNAHYTHKIDLKKFKGSYVVVSNHGSRLDYFYASQAFYPHTLNFVAGYNEFFRSHLAGLFKFFSAIPKRNFVPDLHTIKECNRIIKKGGRLVLFPEGMSSISGTNQPCAVGSGKLLKHLKVPVLYMKLKGAYLTNTKHCLDERNGRVEVEVGQMFTAEQLDAMSEQEIQDKLNSELRHDDYEWNKSARIKFVGKEGMAKNLTDYLYICPKCKKEYTLVANNETVKCNHCGNGATINEYYDLIPLDSSCIIPYTLLDWFNMQRNVVHKKVYCDENFELRMKVKLGAMNKFELMKNLKTGDIVGEGEIVLNRKGLTYTGTRDNEAYSFSLSTDQIPTLVLVTDLSYFQTYYQKEYLEFYPQSARTAEWLFATEELHRVNGGKWEMFADYDYDAPCRMIENQANEQCAVSL